VETFIHIGFLQSFSLSVIYFNDISVLLSLITNINFNNVTSAEIHVTLVKEKGLEQIRRFFL